MNALDVASWVLGFVILLAVIVHNFQDGTWRWRWDWVLAYAFFQLLGRIIIFVVAAHFIIKYW